MAGKDDPMIGKFAFQFADGCRVIVRIDLQSIDQSDRQLGLVAGEAERQGIFGQIIISTVTERRYRLAEISPCAEVVRKLKVRESQFAGTYGIHKPLGGAIVAAPECDPEELRSADINTSLQICIKPSLLRFERKWPIN